MNEIFRFMALRPPDTSSPKPTLDISNPKSPFQRTLTTERNRAIGQVSRRGGSSPGNLTYKGIPIRALRNVTLASSVPQDQVAGPSPASPRTERVRKARAPRKPS